MTRTAPETPDPSPVRFAWIDSRTSDLVWYIGSAAAGWLYAALILWLGSGLENPETDPVFTFRAGGLDIPVTLTVIVLWSWAFVLDGPHLWGTLGRTVMDPTERATRGPVLWKSFLFFLAGPVTILGLWLAGAAAGAPRLALAGTPVFYFLFRLWAYYHVVRQHWGFFRLYKRKAGDFDPAGDRADAWYFNLAMYLPVALFLTAPWYPPPTGGFPDLGLNTAFVGGLSVARIIRPLSWILLAAGTAAYAGYQIMRYRRSQTVNGPKLMLLLATVPLHAAALSHPVLALFTIPLVTAGHNLQYHRIVWSYARKKYHSAAGGPPPRGKRQRPENPYGLARRIFSHPAVYALTGLVFTFALFRGPWIDFLQSDIGAGLDGAMDRPGYPAVGQALFASFLVGWSLQHYYLDGIIWRVGSDAGVRKHLGIEG